MMKALFSNEELVYLSYNRPKAANELLLAAVSGQSVTR